MDAFIYSTWPGTWVCIAILAFIAAVYFAFSDGLPRLIAAPFVVIMLVAVVVFFNAQTHAVIPLDQVAVVENTNTGQIDGDLRPAGIVNVPFSGTSLLYFPSQKSYQWCDDYHPAAAGGIAIKITPCWNVDLSGVDWKSLVIKTGKTNATDILASMHNLLSDRVASVVRTQTIDQLGDQVTISASLKEKAGDVFKDIPLNSVSIQNWDFENPEVGKAYDQAAVSQTGKLVAEADQKAALAERDAQVTRATTQNQILALQTTGLAQAMSALGIVDSQSRAAVLQERLLLDYLAAHPNATIIVSAGGNAVNAGPAIPAQPQAITPTATPAK